MAIVFTFGANDRGMATIQPDANGQLHVHVDGNSNVLGKINLGGIQPVPLMFYGPNAEQPPLNLPEKPSLIFNQISDADTHKTSLQRCREFCQGLDVPVINSAEAIQQTTRDGVVRLLQNIPGLRVPATISCKAGSPDDVLSLINEHALKFPVIQRIAGDHNARSMVLINGPEDVHKLHVFPFDGTEFYLTEYVDFSDESGLFYKHRIAFVDGQVLPRHVNFGPNWIVNSSSIPFMRSQPNGGDLVQKMQDLRDNRLQKAAAALNEIHARLKLDYFGIDCHIDSDGQVLLFEANANMNILIDPIPELSPQVNLIKRAIEKMMQSRSGESMGV